MVSSRDRKENFTDVNSDDVLAKINALNIQQWNYKVEDSTITHIGPVAQDFYAAFHLGGSDKSISMIDPAGVALIGIQALSKEQASTTISLNDIKLRLDSLTATSTASSTSFMSSLESFGASIINGIVHFAEVIIGKLSVSHLTIKNTTDVNKTGYVIYDRATGQPICVYFENGVQKTEPGDCETPVVPTVSTGGGSSDTGTPAPAPEPTPDTTATSTDSTTPPGEEVTPPAPDPVPDVVVPAPAPEPAPAPVSEPAPAPEPAPAETPGQ